jgi:hypothetical protein
MSVRPEVRWALAAALALAIGVVCAEPYARRAAPYYAAVARLISLGHPWTIVSVDVEPGTKSPSPELQLVGDVRRLPEDPRAAGRIISHVQVGEAVETPIVFWTLVLWWPAKSLRQRLIRLAIGIPIFLGLEAVTTGIQLMHSMAEVSAILAGEMNPVTLWERWSRFLEGGGQFVLACGFAVFVISLTKRLYGFTASTINEV